MSVRISTLSVVAPRPPLPPPLSHSVRRQRLPSDYQASRSLIHETHPSLPMRSTTLCLMATPWRSARPASPSSVAAPSPRPSTMRPSTSPTTSRTATVGPVFDGDRGAELIRRDPDRREHLQLCDEDGGSILTLDTPSAPDTIRFTPTRSTSAGTPRRRWLRCHQAPHHARRADHHAVPRDKDAEAEWAAMTRQGANFCEGSVISVVSRDGRTRGMSCAGGPRPDAWRLRVRQPQLSGQQRPARRRRLAQLRRERGRREQPRLQRGHPGRRVRSLHADAQPGGGRPRRAEPVPLVPHTNQGPR